MKQVQDQDPVTQWTYVHFLFDPYSEVAAKTLTASTVKEIEEMELDDSKYDTALLKLFMHKKQQEGVKVNVEVMIVNRWDHLRNNHKEIVDRLRALGPYVLLGTNYSHVNEERLLVQGAVKIAEDLDTQVYVGEMDLCAARVRSDAYRFWRSRNGSA